MPDPFPDRCVKLCDRRPRIVLRDRGERREYRAENPRRRLVTEIVVDGCCMVQETACDFLLLVDDDDAYLIELKGSDVSKAIQQIHATLDRFEKALQPRTIHARVVPTRVPVPNYIATAEKELRNRLRRLGKGNYKAKSRVLEETL